MEMVGWAVFREDPFPVRRDDRVQIWPVVGRRDLGQDGLLAALPVYLNGPGRLVLTDPQDRGGCRSLRLERDQAQPDRQSASVSRMKSPHDLPSDADCPRKSG